MFRLMTKSPKTFVYNYKNFVKIGCCNKPILVQQNRNLSSIESIIRTQTGIFKTLSESSPVAALQNYLLTLHDLSGLPWWGTIICGTVLLRTTVTLPFAVYQYYILAKLENLRSKMPAIAEELKQETAVAIKLYNWDEKQARINYNRSIRKQWNDLVVKENCHPLKATILLWIQIPMWISLSVALRNLVYMLPNQDLSAELTFTELSLGGFSFIPNLTEIDSSLIFPIALGIVNLALIEFQLAAKINEPSKLQKIITNIFRSLSIIMVPIAASVPSCLVLYWFTSSAFGLIQNVVLVSPKVRRFCRIPKTPSELEKPYQQIGTKLKNKFLFMK